MSLWNWQKKKTPNGGFKCKNGALELNESCVCNYYFFKTSQNLLDGLLVFAWRSGTAGAERRKAWTWLNMPPATQHEALGAGGSARSAHHMCKCCHAIKRIHSCLLNPRGAQCSLAHEKSLMLGFFFTGQGWSQAQMIHRADWGWCLGPSDRLGPPNSAPSPNCGPIRSFVALLFLIKWNTLSVHVEIRANECRVTLFEMSCEMKSIMIGLLCLDHDDDDGRIAARVWKFDECYLSLDRIDNIKVSDYFKDIYIDLKKGGTVEQQRKWLNTKSIAETWYSGKHND